MLECFVASRNPENQEIEELIVSHTVQFAKGKYRCELNIRLHKASSDHSGFSFSILKMKRCV
jgi:hypothetical protein